MCVPWWGSFSQLGGRVLVRSIFYRGAGGGPGFAFIFTVLFLSFFLVEFPKSLDKTVPACTPGQALRARPPGKRALRRKRTGACCVHVSTELARSPAALPSLSPPFLPKNTASPPIIPKFGKQKHNTELVPICKVPVGCMHGVMPSMLLSSNGFNIDMRSSTGNWIGSWERCRHQITRGRQERIPIRQGLRKGAEGDS